MSAVSPVAPAASADAAALCERHGSRVLGFCLSRLGSREDAEDATQTTFLNAVGALRRGTVPRAEAAWLLRIAKTPALQQRSPLCPRVRPQPRRPLPGGRPSPHPVSRPRSP